MTLRRRIIRNGMTFWAMPKSTPGGSHFSWSGWVLHPRTGFEILLVGSTSQERSRSQTARSIGSGCTENV